jgi:hypothetical protein
MKITHVRVSVLESGPGYNNQSVTLEAELEEGDNYAEVATELRAKCKSQIKGAKELDAIWLEVNSLRSEAHDLRAAIAMNRAIIKSHEKLGEIAQREGIENPLFDPIPF